MNGFDLPAFKQLYLSINHSVAIFSCQIALISLSFVYDYHNSYHSYRNLFIGVGSQSEMGKDVGRAGESGSRTFSGTAGGGETKPTLPVTPPAGFKLMQDPFTGQLFIIPGTFNSSNYRYYAQ